VKVKIRSLEDKDH